MSWFEKGLAEGAKSIGLALITVGIPTVVTWYVMQDDKKESEGGDSEEIVTYEETVFRVGEFRDSGLYGQTKFLEREGVNPVNYTQVINCILSYQVSTVITSEMVARCEKEHGIWFE